MIRQTRRAIGNLWLVTGGLKAGDRVIVSGLQDVKPGERVRPQPSKLQSVLDRASDGHDGDDGGDHTDPVGATG